MGDERMRHCDLCSLNVYNVSLMSSVEVREMIQRREGRLCIRMYRRPDGTVLTQDCPVGLRAFQKRVARIAGAVFATIIGIFSVSYGQKPSKGILDGSKISSSVSRFQNEQGVLKGTVCDVAGAVIPGLPINLYKNSGKLLISTTRSDDKGMFEFKNLADGSYRIETGKVLGFLKLIVENLEVRKEYERIIHLEMSLASRGSELIGVVGETPMIDLTSNERKTVITREMLDRMPGGRPF